MRRVTNTLYDEFGGANVRELLVRAVTAPLPRYTGARIRANVLRAAGFDVARSAVLCDMPQIRGGRELTKRLHIGRNAFLNIECILDVHDDVVIGDNVALAHGVVLLTTTHEIGPPDQRSGTHVFGPVRIGDGAWLGARVVVLPSVTIGAGAVVAAGAVVTKDVAPNTLVGGVPAKVISTELPG